MADVTTLTRRLGWAGALVAGVIAVQETAPMRAQEGAPPVRFQEHVVAEQIPGGYQVIASDLNKDGRVDLIGLGLSQKGELAWYENPSWARHVIASDLAQMINAAAEDLDGDGIPEIAIATGFTTSVKTSKGGVHLLTHGASPDDLWTRKDLDALPTAHRIRWMRVDNGKRALLVNSPLIGPDADAPEAHAKNQIVYYEGPDWKRQVLSEEEGLMHGILPTAQAPFGAPRNEVLLAAGFNGIAQHTLRNGKWSRTQLTGGSPAAWPKSGSSDVAVGHHEKAPVLSAIEPWHGNQVALYYQQGKTWTRQVLDEQITDGHALAMADLAGSGRDAIVAGERGGQRSVYIYWPPAKLGDAWQKQVLDSAMNASSCVTADVNGDKRPDIACIAGRAPSLKWYENLGK
jgi:hypothetical protein